MIDEIRAVIDSEIINLLERRQELVNKIQELKKREGIEPATWKSNRT